MLLMIYINNIQFDYILFYILPIIYEKAASTMNSATNHNIATTNHIR